MSSEQETAEVLKPRSADDAFHKFSFEGRCVRRDLDVVRDRVRGTLRYWAMTGPIFRFSDTWQLVINTGTTIVTFLMVFLIQNTQNRDARAVHLKLDELIRATKQRAKYVHGFGDAQQSRARRARKRISPLPHEEAAGGGAQETRDGRIAFVDAAARPRANANRKSFSASSSAARKTNAEHRSVLLVRGCFRRWPPCAIAICSTM